MKTYYVIKPTSFDDEDVIGIFNSRVKALKQLDKVNRLIKDKSKQARIEIHDISYLKG
jgi:hypothetical protein